MAHDMVWRRCFGFDTAVEESQRALLAAKVEASSARKVRATPLPTPLSLVVQQLCLCSSACFNTCHRTMACCFMSSVWHSVWDLRVVLLVTVSRTCLTHTPSPSPCAAAEGNQANMPQMFCVPCALHCCRASGW